MLPQTAFAQQTVDEPTLAQTINFVLEAVDWNQSDSWTALWGNIFCRQNITAFDAAISRDVAAGDLLDALFVARLAELNNYTSPVIKASAHEAMELMNMTGSLPLTNNAKEYGDPGNGSFLLYYRYLLYCYPYADTDALATKWNITQAYIDFKTAYLTRGEMLWIDPASNWSQSFSSRYYDEHAETLAMFLAFSDLGISEAMTYAAEEWDKVQAHWNGEYYGYSDNSTVECEMANFAELAAAYSQRSNGSIPYWDRVLADLNYKLLANCWKSPGWAEPGVLVHASGNPQLRLWETTSAIITLQQFYASLHDGQKANFTRLLIGDTPAWKGLTNSSLNMNGTFIGAGGAAPSVDATVDAAATLFLEGIVPQTGSLAIPVRNEQYHDCRTPFTIDSFAFNYKDHSIKVPVNAGTFTFIYGQTPANYTFTRSGTYNIQFSEDWNKVVKAEYTGPINLTVNLHDAPTLSWSYSGAAPTEQYTILRGLTVDSEAPIATTGSTAYVDYSAVNGNIYFYRVETAGKTSADVSVLYDYAPAVFAEYTDSWHTNNFTVQLSMQQAGNATICYRINNDQTKTVEADGQPLISAEGAGNVLEYWSISPLGNNQSRHSFASDLKLDKTAPTVSLSINGGAENTTDPAVRADISATDISGIDQMRFSVNDGGWSSWETFATTKTLNLSGEEGAKQVFVEVQNGAGLTAISGISILLLDSEPTAKPSPTQGNQTLGFAEYSYIVLLVAIVGAIMVAALLRQKAITNSKKPA